MLNVAIISFEHMHGWGYAHALEQLPQVNFTAFAEDDAARADRVRKQFPKAKHYKCWKELLQKESCDAVIITSANVRHKEQAIAAARAGKHILCEKPIATSMKDARAMIDACRKAGVKIQTAFSVRYSPAVKRARTLIKEGKLGKILAIKATNHGSMPGGWFVDKKLSGGGAITDHTVHVADLLRYILGEEIIEVYAEMGTNLHPIKVEDCGLLMLKLSGGAFVSLDTSWSRPPSYKIWGDVTMDFKGTKANLSIDCFPRLLHIYQNRNLKHSTFSGGDDLDLALVSDFAESIIKNKPPSISGEDGMRAMEVSLAAYEAIRTKKPISLPFV
ncbi:MAG TPA: Gfo/Idh/MocA family oxidoreductase [Candidatus Sumerlaeota bacterium]|nr:Gfo/Idh/MocA family oxidoreductase [Candidatus Sumerlaeota bacterium]